MNKAFEMFTDLLKGSGIGFRAEAWPEEEKKVIIIGGTSKNVYGVTDTEVLFTFMDSGNTIDDVYIERIE